MAEPKIKKSGDGYSSRWSPELKPVLEGVIGSLVATALILVGNFGIEKIFLRNPSYVAVPIDHSLGLPKLDILRARVAIAEVVTFKTSLLEAPPDSGSGAFSDLTSPASLSVSPAVNIYVSRVPRPIFGDDGNITGSKWMYSFKINYRKLNSGVFQLAKVLNAEPVGRTRASIKDLGCSFVIDWTVGSSPSPGFLDQETIRSVGNPILVAAITSLTSDKCPI